MSVPAIIRLAPILRLEDLDELRRRGRDVYDTRTFRPLLRKDPVPVVVDHGEREIGHVREFAYREAPESGTWCFAHCRLDEQPGWLGPGAPCSFGSALRRFAGMFLSGSLGLYPRNGEMPPQRFAPEKTARLPPSLIENPPAAVGP